MTKNKIKIPKVRGVYAFTEQRRGDFILFVKEGDTNVLEFMHLPDRYKIYLTKQEFTDGLKSKLLDFVEQIPQDVYNVAVKNIENFQKKA